MELPAPGHDQNHPIGIGRNQARLIVRCLQLIFFIIATLQLDEPFLSAHNERQNQTYDSALHVFHDGWSAVLAPKASFSLVGYETRPFTVMRQEFPFYGVLSWPFVKIFGHDRAVVRLISVLFAIFSIEFVFLILQRWLNPHTAVIGAALWGLSPLILQFGQVPMPDILCTAGMLGAFWFALKSSLPASSAWFLFAILAKVSVIFFGLPILTTLLLARNCRSAVEIFRTGLAWGVAPLIGLLCWTFLEILDPDTPWTVAKLVNGTNGHQNVLTVNFYFFLLSSLLPYGLGILGAVGCVRAAVKKNTLRLKPAVIISLLISNILYLSVVVTKIPEPQYILPLLAWLVIIAMLGLDGLVKGPSSSGRRGTLGLIAILHIVIVFIFTLDLKSSHIPDLKNIYSAAKLIPPGSRVIVAYPFYGASPAIWLNQNVYATHSTNELESILPELQKDGFDYILIMDVKSRSVNRHMSVANLTKMGASLFQTKSSTQSPANLIDYTAPNAPFRQFCDGRFNQIFFSRYVVLYSCNRPHRE